MPLTIQRRRPDRPTTSTNRTAVLRRLIASAGLLAAMALVSACHSGSPTSSPPSSPARAVGGAQPSTGPLALSRCMRAHGVSNFPDPDAQGHLMLPAGGPGGMDPSSPQFQAAIKACQSLADAVSGQVLSPENLDGLAKFAKCMTQHGIAMSAGGNGQVSFPDGLDFHSPQFEAAYHECIKLVPAGLPFGAP